MWTYQAITVTDPAEFDRIIEAHAKGEVKVLSLEHTKRGRALWKITLLAKPGASFGKGVGQ